MFSLICEVPGVLEMVSRGMLFQYSLCRSFACKAYRPTIRVFCCVWPKHAVRDWAEGSLDDLQEFVWCTVKLENLLSDKTKCKKMATLELYFLFIFSVIVPELVKILKVEFAGHYVKGTMSSLATWSSIGSFECQHGIQEGKPFHDCVQC